MVKRWSPKPNLRVQIPFFLNLLIIFLKIIFYFGNIARKSSYITKKQKKNKK
jgi:hypothetical protein